MTKRKEGCAVRDIVAKFEEGHTTKLTTEDRKYVVSWLKITRPYLRKVDVAALLGVSVETITKDWADIDNSLADSMQAIDVGIILAQYGAQLTVAIHKIHESLSVMEGTEKGRTTATYLQYVKAPSELYQGWLKTMKDVGLIGEDGSQVQEETRWVAVTNKAGVTTTEVMHRVNRDIERATKKAFEPGVFLAPKSLEGPDSAESETGSGDTTIQ